MNDAFQTSSYDDAKWRTHEFPYPGLRPFDLDEAEIFFGRDRHCDEILSRLSASNFVTVIGPSGCGKSSLLRAGVMHQLEAGRLYSAGSQWRLLIMRPENKPAWNLAVAVDNLQSPTSGPERASRLMQLSTDLLFDSRTAFDEARARPGFPEGANILLVVDQFEELFTSENDRGEIVPFIDLLLRIYRGEIPRTNCILTMRSDHLGDCSVFPEFADAVNKTFYLTPNLTNDEIRDAIELPARHFDGDFEDGLVERILHDMATENADQLPLMQHLMRLMWTAAERVPRADAAPVLLTHRLYEEFGPLSTSLEKHADGLLEKIVRRPDSSRRVDQRLVEVIFRQLTERRASGQDVRRPTEFGKLASIAGLTNAEEKDELRYIIDQFRGPEVLFLQPVLSVEPVIQDDQRIDIVHECLIRKWPRLLGWVEAEAAAVKELGELVERTKKAKAAHGAFLVAPPSTGAAFSRTLAQLTGLVPAYWRRAEGRARKAVDMLRSLATSGDVRNRLLTALRTVSANLTSMSRIAAILKKTRAAPAVESRTRRYLDRDDIARFDAWRKSWNAERMPNSAWASGNNVAADMFKDVNEYIENSRWDRQFQFGLWAIIVGGLSLLGINQYSELQVSQSHAARLQAERESADLGSLTQEASTVWTRNAEARSDQLAPKYIAKSQAYNDWRSLISGLARSKLDLVAHYWPDTTPQPKPVGLAVDRIGVGRDGKRIAVVSKGEHGKNKVQVFDESLTPIGAPIAVSKIKFKDFRPWVGGDGRAYWLGPNDGMLHIADPMANSAPSNVDLANGAFLRVEGQAVSADHSRVAIIGRLPSGRYAARIVDPERAGTEDVRELELQLPNIGPEKVGAVALGGPNAGRLVIFFQRNLDQPDKPDQPGRIAVWDLASGEQRPSPSADFLTPYSETPSELDLSPDGQTVALHRFPYVNLYTFGLGRRPQSTDIVIPASSELLDKGTPMDMTFHNSDFVVATDVGMVLVWPFALTDKMTVIRDTKKMREIKGSRNGLQGINHRSVNRAPGSWQPDRNSSASFDARGNVFFGFSRDGVGHVQRLSVTEFLGRQRALRAGVAPDDVTPISATVVAPDTGDILVGRDDGSVLLKRLKDGGASLVLRKGSGDKIVELKFARRADGRFVFVALDARGMLITGEASNPTNSAFLIHEEPSGIVAPVDMAVSRDGAILAILDGQRRGVFMRRAEPGQGASWDRFEITRPADGQERTCSVAFSTASDMIALGDVNGNIHIAGLKKGSIGPWTRVGALVDQTEQKKRQSVESLVFSTSGRFLLAGKSADKVEPCSRKARGSQAGVVFSSVDGAWSTFDHVAYTPVSSAKFSRAVPHPLGDLFVLTRWAGSSLKYPKIELVDAQSLGLLSENALLTAPTVLGRGLPLTEYPPWLQEFDQGRSASNAEVRSSGAEIACHDETCWLVSPLTQPDRLAVSRLRNFIGPPAVGAARSPTASRPR